MYKIEQELYLTNTYKKYGVKLDDKQTLATYYQSLTMDYLKDLCRIYEIKGYSKLKKNELVTLVVNTVTDKEALINLFLTTSKEDFKALLNLAKVGKVHIKALDLHFTLRLINLGLVYLIEEAKGYYVVMPTEVSVALKTASFHQFNRQRDEVLNVLTIIKAATNLYGVLTIDECASLVRKYYRFVTPEQFGLILKLADRTLVEFGIDKNLIFAMNLLEGHEQYYNMTKDQAFYYPKANEFVKYADENYYEYDANIRSLMVYLKNSFPNQTTILNDLVSDLVQYLYTDGNFSDIMRIFSMYGITFKDNQHVQGVAGRLQLFYSQMRLRKNRGNASTAK